MRIQLFRAAALLSLLIFVNPCWAQRGVPVPVPRVAPHVPVPHVIPHGGPSHGAGGDDNANPWLIIGGIVAAVVVIFVIVLMVRSYRNRPSAIVHIRIVTLPPGEAPESIRRAWVGMELPLAVGEGAARQLQTVGAVSNRGAEVSTGYLVDGPKALAALEFGAPEAAAWWRQNAPHVAAAGYRFCFPEEVCEKVW